MMDENRFEGFYSIPDLSATITNDRESYAYGDQVCYGNVGTSNDREFYGNQVCYGNAVTSANQDSYGEKVCYGNVVTDGDNDCYGEDCRCGRGECGESLSRRGYFVQLCGHHVIIVGSQYLNHTILSLYLDIF